MRAVHAILLRLPVFLSLVALAACSAEKGPAASAPPPPAAAATAVPASEAPTPVAGARVDPAIPPYEKTSGVSGSLSSVGSDTMNNLMTLWGETFSRLYPNVKLQV